MHYTVMTKLLIPIEVELLSLRCLIRRTQQQQNAFIEAGEPKIADTVISPTASHCLM